MLCGGSMSDDVKKIALFLLERRKYLKLEQKDMYMRIGMKQQQYSRIEAGHDVRLSTLLRVIEGLGLEMSIQPKSKRVGVGANSVVQIGSQEPSYEDDTDDLDFWFNSNGES